VNLLKPNWWDRWIEWGALSALLVALGLVGWFIWPTPYRYTDLSGLPIRIHRITGASEFLAPGHGWLPEDRVDEWTAELPAERTQPPPSSTNSLHQSGTALRLYSQDYDERLPPLTDAETLKEALLP
jgi:hypothetical protein